MGKIIEFLMLGIITTVLVSGIIAILGFVVMMVLSPIIAFIEIVPINIYLTVIILVIISGLAMNFLSKKENNSFVVILAKSIKHLSKKITTKNESTIEAGKVYLDDLTGGAYHLSESRKYTKTTLKALLAVLEEKKEKAEIITEIIGLIEDIKKEEASEKNHAAAIYAFGSSIDENSEKRDVTTMSSPVPYSGYLGTILSKWFHRLPFSYVTQKVMSGGMLKKNK